MRIVPVPKNAVPIGAVQTWLPAPAGCDFTKPLPVAKVTTERGVNQYTVAIELEPGDLEAIVREGRFTVTFFGAAPLFILDVIEPSSSGSVVASSPSDRQLSGAVEGELGTTERRWQAPTPPASHPVQSGTNPGERPHSVVPTSRSG